MAQPTGSDIYVSRPLTNISVAYIQDQTEFVASRVFPPVPVDHQYGSYYIYNKGDWFKTMAQKRAPRTESAGTGWNISTDTYSADVLAVHVDIADQDRANQDSPIIDLDRDATIFVSRDMLLRRELDWATAYFGTGIWNGANADQIGGAADGANAFIQWDRASSTPIEDIEAERLKILRKTGLKPNKLVLGQEVHSILKNHPEIMARIIYTQTGMISDQLLAGLFEVDEVLSPTLVQNTAAEGATDSYSFVQGKSALLAYSAPSPSRMTPSAGYTFEWTGYIGAADRGVRTKKFRMELLAADRVESESAYSFKVVSQDLGVFFSGAVQ